MIDLWIFPHCARMNVHTVDAAHGFSNASSLILYFRNDNFFIDRLFGPKFPKQITLESTLFYDSSVLYKKKNPNSKTLVSTVVRTIRDCGGNKTKEAAKSLTTLYVKRMTHRKVIWWWKFGICCQCG